MDSPPESLGDPLEAIVQRARLTEVA